MRCQVFVAIFVAGLLTALTPSIDSSRNQPAIRDKILITFESVDIAHFSQDTPGTHLANARQLTVSLVIREIRLLPINLFFDPVNLAGIQEAETDQSEMLRQFPVRLPAECIYGNGFPDDSNQETDILEKAHCIGKTGCTDCPEPSTCSRLSQISQ